MTYKLVAATALCATLSAGVASAATYDFKAAAEPNGGTAESIYSVFDTSSLFAGPNLQVTASATDDDDTEQFVYFDASNAGMGVCKDALNASDVNVVQTDGSNRCDPGSDDGLTSTFETLTFEATETDTFISAIWINSNHDSPSVSDTVWHINGEEYSDADGDFTDNSVSGSGDIKIDLGFMLTQGESFDVFGVSGPNSYISAIEVSAVPLPASGLLLAGALGFAGWRARRSRG